MDIRALRSSDDRSAFSSGDELLDRFFRKFAGQNQFKHHLGVSYVAVEGSRVLGFATVAPGHIAVDDLPISMQKGVPRYPVPILRLARLAVDRAAQSQGVGVQLLRFVLQLAEKMSNDHGCAGVVVDAKPAAVDFYEKYGFVPFAAIEGESDQRPRPTTMFLAMRAIKTAGRPSR
jgi:GNAT superfamily N-acetyltransferase